MPNLAGWTTLVPWAKQDFQGEGTHSQPVKSGLGLEGITAQSGDQLFPSFAPVLPRRRLGDSETLRRLLVGQVLIPVQVDDLAEVFWQALHGRMELGEQGEAGGVERVRGGR